MILQANKSESNECPANPFEDDQILKSNDDPTDLKNSEDLDYIILVVSNRDHHNYRRIMWETFMRKMSDRSFFIVSNGCPIPSEFRVTISDKDAENNFLKLPNCKTKADQTILSNQQQENLWKKFVDANSAQILLEPNVVMFDDVTEDLNFRHQLLKRAFAWTLYKFPKVKYAAVIDEASYISSTGIEKLVTELDQIDQPKFNSTPLLIGKKSKDSTNIKNGYGFLVNRAYMLAFTQLKNLTKFGTDQDLSSVKFPTGLHQILSSTYFYRGIEFEPGLAEGTIFLTHQIREPFHDFEKFAKECYYHDDEDFSVKLEPVQYFSEK